MSDAWLEDPKTHWAMRFHQQSKTLDGDVQVVVENGRPMPHSQPALIKSRIHMAYEDAVSRVAADWLVALSSLVVILHGDQPEPHDD